MDCLFIHGNYPAQFRHLAPLIAGAGHRVVFLTERSDAKDDALPGVEIRNYKLHRCASEHTHHYLKSSEDAVLQGQAVLRELNALVEEGFQPRFVVTHAGNGLGLFIKDLLPQTVHIGYFEWYFQPETTQYLTADFNLDVRLRTGLRNLPILQELECCDVAVVPTAWQKAQFPKAYQHKLQVIFDGIDRQFFQPQPATLRKERAELRLRNRETGESFVVPKGAGMISYATRGMETLRGFPEFMRALPSLMSGDKELHAVIAGADRRSYSHEAPSHNGSWKQRLLSELEGQLSLDRVLFTGLLDYNDYRALLWRSDLHCYFTRPYVTSWSLFEATACGAKLAVNRSAATSGIADDDSVTWVTLDDQASLNRELRKALEVPDRRSVLLQDFDLDTNLKLWEKLLNQALQSS